MNERPRKNIKRWLLPLAVAVLLLAELALFAPGWLAARRVAPAASFSGDMRQTPTAELAAGRYLVTVNYIAAGEGGSLAQVQGPAESWTALALKRSSNGVASGWLTLDTAAPVAFGVTTAGEDAANKVELLSMSISAAPALRQAAAGRLAVFAALDLLLLLGYWIWRRRPGAKTLLILGALCVAALAATLPLLSGHAWHGSDLGYHLRRIENMVTGLSAGQFPVRIQPDWVNGYGYAVGVFYGDIFLWFPALLRLIGFGVTQAYAAYVALVNLVTAGLAYWCFKTMSGRCGAALAGAVLYTLAPYRLCDLYTRAALGEYTALAFLPLVACGFWLVYRDAPDAKRRLPGWLLLALGMSGVLQSHLLSLEMTALLLVVFALLLCKKTFTKLVLGRLCGAVGVFAALNAGFLFPLFDYYLTGRFAINQPGGTEPIQSNGALLAQLFGLPADAAAQGVQQELVQDMPLTPGTALWLAALLLAGLLVFWLVRRRKAKAALPGAVTLGLWGLAGGVAAAFAATNLFPWDGLYGLGGPAEALVGSLQFPWRWLGPAVLLLALAAVAALCLIDHRAARTAVGVALCGVSLMAAVGYSRQYTAQAAPVDFYYGTEETNWQMSCEHYLPVENGPVDFNDLPAGPQWSDGITLRSYAKLGGRLMLDAANAAGTDGTVRLTLLYYKGYTARDAATGERLTVENGKNNSATLVLPAGYDGTVQVWFREPAGWRLAELLSVLSAAVLAVWFLRKRKKV